MTPFPFVVLGPFAGLDQLLKQARAGQLEPRRAAPIEPPAPPEVPSQPPTPPQP